MREKLQRCNIFRSIFILRLYLLSECDNKYYLYNSWSYLFILLDKIFTMESLTREQINCWELITADVKKTAGIVLNLAFDLFQYQLIYSE